MTESVAWPEKTREMRNQILDSTGWNDFEFRDDVVVATYYKSATTWVQQIVAQLLFGPNPDLAVQELSLWPDLRPGLRRPAKEVKLADAETQTHRRILKTHLPLDALVFSSKARYLYVARDGRDVLWSLHHHHSNLNDMSYEGMNDLPGRVGPTIEPPPEDVHDYWREWFDGNGHPWWPFWEHIRGWWATRGLPNVMLLHFEALRRDMPGQMRRIASFLDIPIDEARWEEIVEYCSFGWMKEHADKSAPQGGVIWEGGARTFFNRGVNGRWRGVLTPEEVAEYEARAIRELGPECARWLAIGEGP